MRSLIVTLPALFSLFCMALLCFTTNSAGENLPLAAQMSTSFLLKILLVNAFWHLALIFVFSLRLYWDYICCVFFLSLFTLSEFDWNLFVKALSHRRVIASRLCERALKWLDTFWLYEAYFPWAKYIFVFQVSALKKLGMVGRHYILFYQNILYRNCIFHCIFHHFSAYLSIFCSQFIICLGSEQKPR